MTPKSKWTDSPWYVYGRNIACGVLVLIFIRAFMRESLIRAYKIPSGSMYPALQIDDRIIVNELAYGFRNPITGHYLLRFRNPEPGDIVVFIFPQDRTKDYLHRVIAVEGQTVEIRKKQLYIDGRLIHDRYAFFVDGASGEAVSPGGNFAPTRVPPGRVFVLGDNRDKSYDSRYWGFVDLEAVKGKAVVVYWSWNTDGSVDWKRIGTWLE